MPNYAVLSDHELTALLKAEDGLAFTEIYRRYSEKLLIMGYSYSKDRELAEEIVQEVFVGLWERRSLLSVEKLQAYLATSIKFSVFKAIYKQRRRAEIVVENYEPQYATFEEMLHAKFLQEFIDGLVEQLPEKCSKVYTLSRQDGLNNREIAERLNISEKTVEAHLTKALKSVRKSLRERGIFILLISNVLEDILK